MVTDPADGPWNMAVDEALADSVRSGALPFLRFYRWSPGTLSLGRFQNPESGLSPSTRNLPRVRRLTGGGGIWHADELTYSLGCLQSDLGVSGVKPSFEKLCGFLLDTWLESGWDAGFAKDLPGGTGVLGSFTAACFAGHEEYDILVGRKKLGGNAQRRDRNTVFQHGSIPIRLDWEFLETIFLPGFRPDPGSVTDLEACGWSGSFSDLINRLSQAFRFRMATEFEVTGLTPAEASRAGALVAERYGSPGWTETGGGTLRVV